MNWLQTFAFIALAGSLEAYSGFKVRQNYFARSDEKTNRSTFPYIPDLSNTYSEEENSVSSVVSLLSGPLCGAFHIQTNMVVTAASCVYREIAESLVVISKSILSDNSKASEFLDVLLMSVHPNYKPSTDEHNIAILMVEEPLNPVLVLSLPTMSSDQGKGTNTFIVKSAYDDSRINLYSKRVPVVVQSNLNDCTSASFPPNEFYCVSREDSRPFSVGLSDVGTPLIYQAKDNLYFLGLFTGRNYNSERTSYLYQNAVSSFEFIRSVLESTDSASVAL